MGTVTGYLLIETIKKIPMAANNESQQTKRLQRIHKIY